MSVLSKLYLHLRAIGEVGRLSLAIKTWLNHRYLLEVDCSSGQFKSSKMKDKEYTLKFKCTKFLNYIQPWWLGGRVVD